jgi:hypothetical protein
MNPHKFKHFYFNKYLLSKLKEQRYFLSYDYQHKLLWFRNAKVGTRTIHNHFEESCAKNKYIYGSEMSYSPSMFKDFFKFAFVRNPQARFISAFKDKVLKQNYFKFTAEDYAKMQDLNEFLTWVETLDIRKCDRHLRAQTALIDVPQLDFLGRFENFSDDLNVILNRLNAEVPEIGHLNKSAHSQIILDASQQRRIEIIYAADFKAFYS